MDIDKLIEYANGINDNIYEPDKIHIFLDKINQLIGEEQRREISE